MRRMLWPACLGTLVALIAPAAADADVLDAFERLAARNLDPPPLVPTTAPARLRPIDTTITNAPTVRRSAYALRLVHYTGAGPDAVLALSGGDYKSMKAALRDHRGQKRRSLRVRGHRAFLVTHYGDRHLLWSEGGRVLDLGSGTPRKVSVGQLRAAAAGLEPLRGYYIGGSSDPNKSSYARIATTARTLTLYFEFNADCNSTPYAGQGAVTLVPMRGNSFSYDIAQIRLKGPWTGTVSGTVDHDSATVQYQVSATIDGQSCSGAETITAPRHGH